MVHSEAPNSCLMDAWHIKLFRSSYMLGFPVKSLHDLSNSYHHEEYIHTCKMEVSLRTSLIAMRTKAELQANLETTTVYVVEIPLKAANGILRCVEPIVDSHSTDWTQSGWFNYSWSTYTLIASPSPLCEDWEPSTPPSRHRLSPSSFRLFHPRWALNFLHRKLHTYRKWTILGRSQDKQHGLSKDDQRTCHFLVCATSNLSFEGVAALLESFQSPSACNLLSKVRTLTVPLFPPTSDEQAKQWSRSHWPTVYKRNNPFGPHWKIISHAEGEILDQAGNWINLARSAGDAVSRSLLGESIGAVIVDRNTDRTSLLIAAAGDARWGEVTKDAQSGCGNVMAHAVMRAIGLVARKRRESTEQEASGEGGLDLSRIFADKPLTSVEKDAYSINGLAPGGYLCLGLEIYVTHEPCVMCSMAILHSRFARIVFRKQLPRTGGITAEVASEELKAERQPHLGYGLFWRPELSWKLLAWQWVDGQGCSQVEIWGSSVQA